MAVNIDAQVEKPKLTLQEKRQIYNKNYLNTENGKQRRSENIKKFYEAHPEKKENYYKTHIDTFAKCAKEYYEKNKEAILAKRKAEYHAMKAGKLVC